MTIRVGAFGSVFYRIAAALRRHTDIAIDVFVDERTLALATALRDEDAIGREPWIRLGPWLTTGALGAPWRAPVTTELREYDLVLASELGPVFAQFTGRPWCFLPVGGDLTVTPFPILSRQLRHGIGTHARAAALAGWQRRGIRRAAEIWSAPFGPTRLALRRLGAGHLRSPDYLPIAVDDTFRDSSAARVEAAARFPEIANPGGFVVLHPSRLMTADTPFLRETGQWKRNEVVVDAFAELLRRRPDVRPVLVMIDQSYSADRDHARRLCVSAGIADHVVWARNEGEEGFSWREMRDLYLLADVVLDDFGAGWFGMVVLEGLAAGRPVVSHIDQQVMEELYGWDPVLEAVAVDEVASHLERLADDPVLRADLGRQGREWIEQHHGSEAIARAYEKKIRSLLA